MSEVILMIERSGHRILMDRRDGYLRVVCNGAVHAQFNEGALGEIRALEHATAFAAQIETDAVKYPKVSS